MNVIRPVSIGDTGSFTRASTKRFIGADGFLQTAPIDVPAFQYDPANLKAAPVVLLEPAATNICTFSEDYTNASYTKVQATVTANTDTAPDGTVTMSTFTGVAGQTSYVQKVIAVAAATNYAISEFIKAGTAPTTGMRVYDAALTGVIADATISWSAGVPTISAATGSWVVAPAAKPSGVPGVFRITGTINSGANASIGIRRYVDSSAAGLTSKWWGAQFVAETVATSYIKTVAAAVARSADVINGTGLIYSSAVETAPAAYNAATTYAVGATASVAGAAGLLTVYRSLQAVNLGQAPAASPAWWVNIGTTYQVYSTVPTYAIGDRVINAVTHRVYQSLVNANTNQPLTDQTKWFDVAPTNRWAAFDNVVGTSTVAPVPLLMIFKLGPIDSLGLINITGDSFTAAMVDGTTVVWKGTSDLTNDILIDEYDKYFFEDVVNVGDLAVKDIPPYYDGILSFALAGATSVSAGVFVAGMGFDVGGTRFGARTGIISYSKKVTDSAGKTSLKKGANSKRMSLSVVIDNSKLDLVQRVLADLDGVATVVSGAENLYSSLILFCFIKEFDIEISYPRQSLCSAQLEGLI